MVALLFLLNGKGSNEAVPETVKTELDFNFENKLTEIISKIKGVGRVGIFVNYESGTEEVVQTDITEKKDGDSFDRSEKTVLTGSGSSQRPFVKKRLYPKVSGVIVVCDGGGDIGVRSNIISAVKAVTGLSAAKIGVFEMKKGGNDVNN